MDRVRRLHGLWNWLPAFRAVAETEHLPSAAARLFVTAPALSRSLKLLEEALGTPLFDRVGKRLKLNGEGRELLKATRDAMRRLDDAVVAILEEEAVGPVRISGPLPFLSRLVVPMIRTFRDHHPRSIPVLCSATATEANSQLLAGELDIALLDDPVPHPEIVVERLMTVGYGVYCGRSHPLYEVESPTPEQITDYPFAGPPFGANDHWPADLARTIGMTITHLHLGIEVCERGLFVAVLPDLVASDERHRDHLRRLPFDPFGDTALYLLRRRPTGKYTVLDVVHELLREQAQSLDPS